MKYTIKDITEGNVNVINDGTLEQLREVLKKAFPEGPIPNGSWKYYVKSNYNGDWGGLMMIKVTVMINHLFQ